MGAALRGRDQVDVTFGDRLAARGHPLYRPVHRLVLAGERADERFRRQQLETLERLEQVVGQPVLVVPLGRFLGLFDVKLDPEPGAQYRFRAQHVLQPRHRKRRAVEVFRIRPEAQRGARVFLADAAGLLELGFFVAVGETNGVFLALAAHAHVELLRQRVDHRHADAVQAAGKLVILVGKLAARVQLGEDNLDPGYLLLRMEIDRHAAAVIDHAERLVGVQNNPDLAGMTGNGLVDTIIHHLLREVIGSGGVGIHSRPLLDRFEPRQDFDRGGVVLIFQMRWFLGLKNECAGPGS